MEMDVYMRILESNSLQGDTRQRSWESEDGKVEVRVDFPVKRAEDGERGYGVSVKRVGNVTWRRWRASSVSAAELFEKAVDRIVRGVELGSL